MWKSTRYTILAATLLLALALALGACDVPDPFVASSSGSSMSVSTVVAWPTFTDRGNDGFTISYPPTWKAMISGFNDGFFSNAATGTTMEVRVTTVPQPPVDVLAQAQQTPPGQPPAGLPQRPITVTQRTIAGHPAVEVFTAYYHVPTPVAPIHNGGYPGISGGRVIVMAATNSAGTTNVYTFVVNYALDAATNITPASLADNPVILQMVSTFRLPATIDPALTQR